MQITTRKIKHNNNNDWASVYIKCIVFIYNVNIKIIWIIMILFHCVFGQYDMHWILFYLFFYFIVTRNKHQWLAIWLPSDFQNQILDMPIPLEISKKNHLANGTGFCFTRSEKKGFFFQICFERINFIWLIFIFC